LKAEEEALKMQDWWTKGVAGPWQLQPNEIRVRNNLQPDTKSNLNPYPNLTTKQHAIVNIQLNMVACLTYPDKLIWDMLHRLYDFRLYLSHCQAAPRIWKCGERRLHSEASRKSYVPHFLST